MVKHIIWRSTCDRGQVAELKTWVVLRSSQVKTTWGETDCWLSLNTCWWVVIACLSWWEVYHLEIAGGQCCLESCLNPSSLNVSLKGTVNIEWHKRKYSGKVILLAPGYFVSSKPSWSLALALNSVVGWNLSTLQPLHLSQSGAPGFKVKGRIPLPKRMNFRKSSKRPLTPPPHFRKVMLRISRQKCDKSATKVRMFIWRASVSSGQMDIFLQGLFQLYRKWFYIP